MDQLLSFALNALGHFIQDVSCLMHPATLLGDSAIFFLHSDPEAERSVADGQLRRGGQAQAFELPKQFTPGWVLSRYPSTTASNSLVPSSVAPIKISTQVRSSSSRTLK